MKKFKFMAMVLLIGIVAISCEKEEGPQGPAGPAGTNGTNGTNGNANVTMYGFGAVTINSVTPDENFHLPISGGTVDSSVIISYYQPSIGAWYPVGEMGPLAHYLTRSYLSLSTTYSTFTVVVEDPDGTPYSGASISWDSVRIFVIPANIFKSAPAGKVDFNDYHSVASYYTMK